MKVLSTKTLKDGRRRLVVELGAKANGDLLWVESNSFFNLAYPLEEQVVESHHIAGLSRVAWDAYSQKWVEA